MKPEDNIQEPLTVEVLQAYLQGTLSPDQQEQVRQLAAENPLYQEALEGFKYVDDEYPLGATLADINARIRSVNSKREKVLWLRPLVEAASIIVLLGVAYIIYVTTSQPNTDAIYAEHYEKYPVTGRAAQEGPASSISFDSLKPGYTEPSSKPVPKAPIEPKETPVTADKSEMVVNDLTATEDELEENPVVSEPTATPTAPPAGTFDLKRKPNEQPTAADYGNAAQLEKNGQQPQTVERQANKVTMNAPANEVERTQLKDFAPALSNARELYEANEYEKAITLYNQRLATDPNHAESLFYSSLCLMELGNHKEALKRLERILNLPPSEYTEPAGWYRALTLIKLDKVKKAKAALEEIQQKGGTYSKQAEEMLKQF